MHPGHALAAASVCVWLGMVLAISFLEAPLKFRAPGITTQLGLGIGRLVFAALNRCEVALTVVLGAGLAWWASASSLGGWMLTLAAVPPACLLVQLLAVRPRLRRRSDEVLAGRDGPRTSPHLVYVAVEGMKTLGLVVAAATLLLTP